MLNFQKKLEIAVSDILSSIVSVGFLKVKPKANKKSEEPRPGFIAYLFFFQMDTQYKNLKYPKAKKKWVDTQLLPILIWSYGFYNIDFRNSQNRVTLFPPMSRRFDIVLAMSYERISSDIGRLVTQHLCSSFNHLIFLAIL